MRSIVERWFEAGDSGDLERFDEVLAPDVVVHAPMGLSSRGIEAEREVWRAALEAIPGLRHDVREVVDAGDAVVARAVVTGTFAKPIGGLAPTGLMFRLDQMVLVHVADDRIVEAWEVADLSPLWGGAAPADAADEPA
jgi:predicted ester cyclase